MKINVDHILICHMIHVIHGKIKDTQVIYREYGLDEKYIDGDNPDIFCQIVNRRGKSYWREVKE